MHRVVRDLIETMKPRFGDPDYKTRVDRRKREKITVTPPVRPVSRPRPRGRGRRPPRHSVRPRVGTQNLRGSASAVVMESTPLVDPLPVESIKVEQTVSLRSGPASPISYDRDLWNDLIQVQIHEIAVASGMPPLEHDAEESQMPSIEEEEVTTPEKDIRGMPSLEGATSADMASVAVSPLQSDLADVSVLPCPEKPEEI